MIFPADVVVPAKSSIGRFVDHASSDLVLICAFQLFFVFFVPSVVKDFNNHTDEFDPKF